MARTKQMTNKSPTGKSAGVNKKTPHVGGSKKSIPSYAGKNVTFTARSGASLDDAETALKSKRRFKPGTVTLRKIVKAQRGTGLMLRRLPFQRYVRDVAVSYKDHLRWQPTAIHALQEAVEARIIQRFKMMQLFAIHSHRKTVQPTDHALAKNIEENDY